MKNPRRRVTKSLTIHSETVRLLGRVELAAVAAGADSAEPCIAAKPAVSPSKVAPC